MTDLHVRAGCGGAGPYALEITPTTAGWGHASLRILHLAAGAVHQLDTGEEELVVLPLGGSCTVACDGEVFTLDGRPDPFSRVSDLAYVPRDASAEISSVEGARLALAGARCTRRLTARYRPAQDVPVEVRGAGSCSRQVNNFCSADSFEADRLIAVEVLTPSGNWSSYPPHKHDERRPAVGSEEAGLAESELEEIYYFEVAGGGMGYQRVYGTPARPIDVLAEVRSGDAVLVPHGWHGPSIAAPGYDLYYLNVMSGDERVWVTCDDPAHTWVRDTWTGQPADPRLPLTTATGRARE